MTPSVHTHRAHVWQTIIAFACLYISWGTTYYAIKVGVETLPPALFAGTRLGSAGAILFAFLALRGQRLWLPWRELANAAIAGVCMFVVGNWLITVAEKSETSSAAAVLVASTPIWFALLEALWPWGERLTIRGWLGLGLGLAGVFVLLTPKLRDSNRIFADAGPWLILGSAFSWALGSFILRRRTGSKSSHLLSAAYQMTIGGSILSMVGLCLGEAGELNADSFTPAAVYSYFYLLVVGSLVGFVAYNWLLGHVSGAMVGTYAYVNPVVAIFVGWYLGNEVMSVWIVGGMAVVLAGVALVRVGGVRASRKRESIEVRGERETASGTMESVACGSARDG